MTKVTICAWLSLSIFVGYVFAERLVEKSKCTQLDGGKVLEVVLSNDVVRCQVTISETPFDTQKDKNYTAIWIHPKLTNLKHIAFGVKVNAAFYDSAGSLVAVKSQDWPSLNPAAQDFQLASCFCPLLRSELKKIVKCELSVITGPPGKDAFDLLGDDSMEEEE